METTHSSQAFLDRLTARDFEQLALTMAPDAVFRMLLPRGPDDAAGAEAIARRFEGWFGGAASLSVLSAASEQVGRRRLLRWRLRLSRDGRSTEVIEQVAFVDEGSEGISRIDMLCSGFMREVERT